MLREDDYEKKISLRFIQILNRHLPAKRRTLRELMMEEIPSVKNHDGSIHTFDKKELEKLASIIPGWEHNRLRLPIYLEMSSSMERGTIRISDRIECRVISRILQKGEAQERKGAEKKDSMIISTIPTLQRYGKNSPHRHSSCSRYEVFVKFIALE